LRLANPDVPEERRLIDHVIEGCVEKNIRDIPPICIGHTNIINAASAGGQLIVFTTEIMKRMPREQLRAVIGHELSHHRHAKRDFTVMGLALGLLPEAMYFSKYYPSNLLEGLYRHGQRARNTALTAAGFAIDILVFTLPMNIYRLFMEREADREGADYAGARAMGDALQTIQGFEGEARARKEAKAHGADNILTWALQGVARVFHFLLMPLGSHPPTASRIEAMRAREAAEGPGAHETASDEYKKAVQATLPGTYINAHKAEHGVLREAALGKAAH
jgi:Zn-dependent protease with chaperone function